MLAAQKRHRSTALSIFLVCACAGFPFSSPAAGDQDQASLRRTITTLHQARNNIASDHRDQSQQRAPTETEHKDLLLFLSYLDGRILYYCRELSRTSGPEALTALPCPVPGSPEASRSAAVPVPSSLTPEEKVNALDKSFNVSLGEFDDMLLKEQEQIAMRTPRQRESSGDDGSAGGGPGQAGSGSGSAGDGQAAEQAESDGSARGPAGTESNRGAGAGGTKQSRLPPTAGSTDLSRSDDDIVARQLKEAAEREPDPEIKARLWEEYRKYKEGIR